MIRRIAAGMILTGALAVLTSFAVPAPATAAAGSEENTNREYGKMRENMIEEQLVSRGIRARNVLDAFRRVPRHEFVPGKVQQSAYDDSPLPIGHEQTISQPYMVAYMTEMLQVKPDDKVLEIGTGSGYQAAILAEIAEQVYTIEIVEALYRQSRAALERLGYDNIHFRLGNGWLGWPEHAPFDKIIVTAAPDKVPPALVDQLAEGGRMILPVGGFFQHIVIGEKHGNDFRQTETIPVRFVPLVEKATEEK